MRAIYRISTELCIMEICGESSMPTFEREENIAYINGPYIHKPFKWLPIEISFNELTIEQREYFICSMNNMLRCGVPMRFNFEIETDEGFWSIEGCYVDVLIGNVVTIKFDKAILHT